MAKARYIIINSEDNYFVEINAINKIVFTKDKKEATTMDYSDTEELIPLIEQYSGHVAMAEPTK